MKIVPIRYGLEMNMQTNIVAVTHWAGCVFPVLIASLGDSKPDALCDVLEGSVEIRGCASLEVI